MTRRALLPIAFCALLPQAAAIAEEPSDIKVLFPEGRETCYARDYTPEHLASHPDQRVARMLLWSVVYPEDVLADQPAGEFPFGIAVQLRSAAKWFWNTGMCRPEGDALSCYIECDGGGFAVERDGAASVLLRNREGFAVESCGGGEDTAEPEELDGFRLEPGKDDKVFRLTRLTDAECAAARAPFKFAE